MHSWLKNRYIGSLFNVSSCIVETIDNDDDERDEDDDNDDVDDLPSFLFLWNLNIIIRFRLYLIPKRNQSIKFYIAQTSEVFPNLVLLLS